MINPEDKITFGKYKGKTFEKIAKIDSDYISWLDKNVKDVNLPKKWIECQTIQIGLTFPTNNLILFG